MWQLHAMPPVAASDVHSGPRGADGAEAAYPAYSGFAAEPCVVPRLEFPAAWAGNGRPPVQCTLGEGSGIFSCFWRAMHPNDRRYFLSFLGSVRRRLLSTIVEVARTGRSIAISPE
ncbi:hypothetical protein GCM10010365_52530 [Streptomyces poonensis]|uniref:Uncharacterized protein n=1 Tax=Streptomyces poonensis TaxID=68255 RepID=A0A918PX12_9ACTN|nr:hypothetical protein GCM10010365_52530 [Streptomyces poonensis]GLJ89084.1 hypothetical protein GCM10017589_16840 [Streptomyces poonensis]